MNQSRVWRKAKHDPAQDPAAGISKSVPPEKRSFFQIGHPPMRFGEAVVSGRIVFRHINRHFENLQATAFRTLEIVKFIPGAEHHFSDRKILIPRRVAADAARMTISRTGQHAPAGVVIRMMNFSHYFSGGNKSRVIIYPQEFKFVI
jgi:hypothetical protein